MKIYISILSLFLCITVTAQTTSIPDQNFEQHLINEGIDSDGVINGEVLTSDIASVLSLDLNQVSDLTGLEDFTALESLTIEKDGFGSWVWPPDIEIDLTANINLINVEIFSFEGTKTLNVSGLVNLENLTIAEVRDDAITMFIEELDLSTNPNIKNVEIGYLDTLREINLQNGNNINTTEMLINVVHYVDWPICIKVDDATAAINNNAPYNTWTMYGVIPNFYDQGECTLAIENENKIELALYPNPVQNEFQIESLDELQSISVFSITGKKVAHFGSQRTYDISQLPTGVYFAQIKSTSGKSMRRVVKK